MIKKILLSLFLFASLSYSQTKWAHQDTVKAWIGDSLHFVELGNGVLQSKEDTTVKIGGNNGYDRGIWHWMKTSNEAIWHSIHSIAENAYTPSWAIMFGEYENSQQTRPNYQKNHNMRIVQNFLQTEFPNEPEMSFSMETFALDSTDTLTYLKEWWFGLDYDYGGYEERPFGVTSYYKAGHSVANFKVKTFEIFDEKGDGNQFVRFDTRTTGSGLGDTIISIGIQDTGYISFSENNTVILMQGSTLGGAVHILKINDSDNLSLLPAGDFNSNEQIQLNTPIVGYNDSDAVRFGRLGYAGLSGFMMLGAGDGGGFWWNGVNRTFNISSPNGNDIDDWNTYFDIWSKAHLAIKGNLGLDVNVFDSNDDGVLYLKNGTAPISALANGVKIYSENGIFKTMDGSGNVVSLGTSFSNNGFFSHDPSGSGRLFNPYLENFAFAGTSRFGIADTGFQTISQYTLFDLNYETYATIDSSDTGKVYIDLAAKSEVTNLAYSEGYFYVHFYGESQPQSVSGGILYVDSTNWTAMTNVEDISNTAYNSLYRLTVPISANPVTDFRIFVVASATEDALVSEIEYYPLRAEQGQNISPVVTKVGLNRLTNKTSWVNPSNQETAYIDSTGKGGFDDITADSITANYISVAGAVAATGAITGASLNVGTITSTDGRFGTPNHPNRSADSTYTRIDKLDEVDLTFGIQEATGITAGSYSMEYWTNKAINLDSVMIAIKTDGGANDTLFINLEWDSDATFASSTKLWTSDLAVTSTTGIINSAFNNSAVLASDFIRLTVSDVGGVVTGISFNMKGKND